MRQAVASLFHDVVGACSWLVPQKTPEEYVHSYYTYVARLTGDGPEWAQFRKKFVELGGDGFYGAWLPVYREPVFQKLSHRVSQTPGRFPQYAGRMPDYREVSCPVLEEIQGRLIHFKTNYFDLDTARRQADILARTIQSFSGRGA